MKVILDTNVWVSGLLWGGIPRQVLKLARDNRVRVYISTAQLEELVITLSKPKLQPKLQQLGENATSLLNSVSAISQTMIAPVLDIASLRDPDDAIILAAAIVSNADAIVTGDRDLLILTEFSGIPILTPQTFLTQHFPTPQ